MKIAIIGGGPAGLFTAIALKQKKHEVFVFEADAYDRQRAGEHLGAESRALMKNLSIPNQIIEDNSIRCSGIDGAWGKGELLSRSSIFNPYGEGIILSRPKYDLALAKYCQEINIRVETECRVSTLKQIDELWEISTKDHLFQADFIIDASGRNSKFNKTFGTSKIAYDDLIGISKVLRATEYQKLTSSQLLIESIANGWWYSVQLQSGTVVATFMTSAKLLASSKESQEVFWKHQLKTSKHTKQKLESFEISENIFTQSAKTQILQKVAGKRWLAVGDAAMSYDPLSSAGILKGMRMGISAAAKINDWAQGNNDALDEYDQDCHKIFAEYLTQKEAYYNLEKRFNDNPFWYSRNIQPKSLNNFMVLPHQSLQILNGNHEDRLDYLTKELPEVNFQTLLNCIETQVSAQLVLKEYLSINNEVVLEKYHFQAIESLKQIGIISVS